VNHPPAKEEARGKRLRADPTVRLLRIVLGERKSGSVKVREGCASSRVLIKMIRYFFDVVSPENRSELDYSGRELPTADKACHLAETIAFDLAIEADDKWHGWAIYVRNFEGLTLFTVPVRSDCLAAA